ncbi:MAG: hypothetical protein HY821_22405, partial [Acidobacteria bacterium]|nr:hypothetical protein [Acidobacteriota bacterium]
MHRPRNSLANVTFYATIKAVPGANGGRWAEFTPSQTLTINSGDFLIGFSIDSSVSTKPAALDTNSPQKRSW